jgi:hypothetical protein
MREDGEDGQLPIKEIAEVVKSMFDPIAGAFPRGETGVATHIGVKYGDTAGELAEKLCIYLIQKHSDNQQMEAIRRLSGTSVSARVNESVNSTSLKKFFDIIKEAEQVNELSPDLMRRASDAATAKADSLPGPENKAARQKARGQEEKFYGAQVSKSNANPAAGTHATSNAYIEKLKQHGWNQLTDTDEIQQAAAKLGWDKYSTPPEGVTWFAHGKSGEAAYIDPKNGQLVRSGANGQQRVSHSFGNAKDMHPSSSDERKWNANHNTNIFQPGT